MRRRQIPICRRKSRHIAFSSEVAAGSRKENASNKGSMFVDRGVGGYFECAEMKLLGCIRIRRQIDKRERLVREFLPDRQIFSRDVDPAIPQHVPPRLGD